MNLARARTAPSRPNPGRLAPVLATALLLAAASPPALAQATLLWQFDGAAPEEKLGRSVAGAGDLDGDGHDDVIVGIPGALSGLGQVVVFSGGDGGVLHAFDGVAGGLFLGSTVANAGDVDNDGVDDVIAGAPSYYPGASAPPGYARVWSGADGSVLHTIFDTAATSRFGSAVAGVGDVDGDGHSDFLVGAPGPAGIGGGFARLYSGIDGTVLTTGYGASTSNFGHALAGVGDVDDDGTPDFAISAPGYDKGKKLGVGQVTVYSGASLMPLRTLTGKKPAGSFGWSLAAAGDVNGDGRPDLIAGSIGAAPGKKQAAGQVEVFSGSNFKRIGLVKGAAEKSFLGSAVAGAGDVDGDGRDDVILGASGVSSFGGQVLVVSGGPKPRILFTFTGAPGETFGDAVAGAGDVDGDGVPDLVIGGWSAGTGGGLHAGRALVYRY